MAKAAADGSEVLIEGAQAALKLDASPAAQKLAKGKLKGLASTPLREWLVGYRRFARKCRQRSSRGWACFRGGRRGSTLTTHDPGRRRWSDGYRSISTPSFPSSGKMHS